MLVTSWSGWFRPLSGLGLVLSALSCAAGKGGSSAPGSSEGPAKPDQGGGSTPSGAGSGPKLDLGGVDPGGMPLAPMVTHDGPSPIVPCNGPCRDFPAEPQLDPKAPQPVPADAAARFADAAEAAAPCVFEPEPSAIFPRNWLRPRVNFIPPAGHDLFEIRLHTDKEANDLVVYTTGVPWHMPKDWWTAMTSHVGEEWQVELSVRSVSSQGGAPSQPAELSFTIAPAEANGTLVYWTSTGVGSLKGFAVGDENVVEALTPPQVRQKTSTCIGCHTSTPDGKFAGFVVPEPRAALPPNQNTFTSALGSLETGAPGEVPTFLGAGARQFMDTAQTGLQAYSAAHWQPGDHVMIAQSGRGRSELYWVDLEAATPGLGSAYGILKREGDPKGGGAPSWSRGGERIFYVSTDTAVDGRLDGTDTDVYWIPYNDKQGGPATKLAGASAGEFAEYYPTISGDDRLIAFNRVPNGVGIYNSPVAEVLVVPADGGEPARLVANDPPACTQWPGPGPSNTWPKWSPEVQKVGGVSYYWLVFASTRNRDYRPQLHMTGVAIAEGSNEIRTHGAVHVWNQPETESNHTPAWDVFKIPKTPPPTVVK